MTFCRTTATMQQPIGKQQRLTNSLVFDTFFFILISSHIDSFEAKYKSHLPRQCNVTNRRKWHTIIYGAQNN